MTGRMGQAELWIDQPEGNHEDRDRTDDVRIAIALDEARIEEHFKLYDFLEIVWLADTEGAVQPLIWPMLLHKHDQDCNRA